MSAPVARQGTSVLLRVYVYDAAQRPRALYDPAGGVRLNLRDPAGTLVVDGDDAEQEAVGIYQYLYQLEADAPDGPWTADWEATNGAQAVSEPPFVAFVVVDSPG